MRAIVQRVLSSKLEIDNNTVAQIGKGIVCFVGFGVFDDVCDLKYCVNKVLNLRIFEDAQNKLNLCLKDLSLELLVIPNFTLYADARNGNRPNFVQALEQEKAKVLYDQLVLNFLEIFKNAKFGIFQADMKITVLNDGPINILIDSKKNF